MTKPYQPKGRMAHLLVAMRADDHKRVWTPTEMGAVMGVSSNHVAGTVDYALKAQILFRGKNGRYAGYSLTPFPPEAQFRKRRQVVTTSIPCVWNPAEDTRIPRVVPDWKPPVMVPPRSAA